MIHEGLLTFRADFCSELLGYLYKAETLLCSEPTLEVDYAAEMTNKRCPKGSAKIVLCFVKEYWLRDD